MMYNGVANSSAQLKSTCGWMPSRPGDLSGFSFLRCSATSSSENKQSVMSSPTKLVSSPGTSPSGSSVKTDWKNLFRHGRHWGGGETGGHVPPRFEGWGTQYQMSPPPRFLNLCVCPPKVLYPYKFRLERGLKLCIFSSTIQNFLRQGGFAPLQSPKSCKRIIFDRKGT